MGVSIPHHSLDLTIWMVSLFKSSRYVSEQAGLKHRRQQPTPPFALFYCSVIIFVHLHIGSFSSATIYAKCSFTRIKAQIKLISKCFHIIRRLLRSGLMSLKRQTVSEAWGCVTCGTSAKSIATSRKLNGLTGSHCRKPARWKQLWRRPQAVLWCPPNYCLSGGQ